MMANLFNNIKEAELAHHVSKVEDSAPQVSVAT